MKLRDKTAIITATGLLANLLLLGAAWFSILRGWFPLSSTMPVIVFGLAGVHIAIGAILRRIVLSRLDRLNAQVHAIASSPEASSRLNLDSKDEVGDVAISINTMLGVLDMAHRELAEAKRAAEQASLAKSEFVSNMSHEIRTPMNGIIGMNSILLQSNLTPQQRFFVNTALDSSRSLLDIINQILDFSKIEAGKLELHNSSFSLREILSATLRTASIPAFNKGLELVCDISPSVPDALIGDDLRLKQVLTNLLGNAIKFTERGHVVVKIRTENDPLSDAVRLCCSVTDTGFGIYPEQLSKLFSAFVQADSSTNKRFGGTGLGLTISKQLVELMEGKISVTSSPGVGSCFSFDVLLKQDTSAPLVPDIEGLNDWNVTLIAAEPSVRDATASNLKEFGARVRSFDWSEIFKPDQTSQSILRKLVSSELGVGNDRKAIVLIAPVDVVDYEVFENVVAELTQKMDQRVVVSLAPTRFLDSPRFEKVGARLVVRPTLIGDLKQQIVLQQVSKPLDTSGLHQIDRGSLDSAPLPLPESTAKTVAPMNVLVVDDVGTNRLVAKVFLEQLGHKVFEASDGLTAFDICQERFDKSLSSAGSHTVVKPFDLILMDLQMPDINGMQATALIRAKERELKLETQVPIVAVSASVVDDESLRRRGVEISAALSKPIEFGKLSELLERYGKAMNSELLTKDSTAEQRGRASLVNSLQSLVPGPQELSRETLNLSDVCERYMNDDGIVCDALSGFLEESEELLGRVTKEFSANNLDALRKAAHAIKGSCSSVSAIRAQKLAHKVEESATITDPETLRNLVSSLEQEISCLREIVSKIVNELTKGMADHNTQQNATL